MDVVNVNKELVNAASMGDFEGFKSICKSYGGEPFERPSNAECCPFHTAAMVGCTELVRYILENCSADVERDVNLREEDDQKTALHFTAANGHAETVKLLLSRGAEPDPSTFGGQTPMHYAAENGHTDVIVILIEYGADPDIKNNQSQTPAHLAAWYNHPRCFEPFVKQYGPRSNRKKLKTTLDIDSLTPFVKGCCEEITAFAVPPADLCLKDDWDKSPIDLAAEKINMYSECLGDWEAVASILRWVL